MKFLIITNDQQEEVWINSTEIAAMLPSRHDTYKCQVQLKNGHSFRSIATPEEIHEGQKKLGTNYDMYMKV